MSNSTYYPQKKTPPCIVYLVRKPLNFVSWKNQKALCVDLKLKSNRIHHKKCVDTYAQKVRAQQETGSAPGSFHLAIQNFTIQDQMLRIGQATLHASIQFVKERVLWVYVINGVGIVLSGLSVVAGFGVMASSAATGNMFANA